MTSVTPESNVPPSGPDPEGRSGGDAACTSKDSSGAASPNYLKWAESLPLLLNDPVGLELFQEYLEQEDADRFHMLKFWLACRGVPKQPSQDTNQCIRVIYKQLFLKIQQGISEELRKSVTQQIRDAMTGKVALSVSVFSEPCRIVESVMNSVMYPNFLGSETYLNFVQKMQGDVCNVDNNNREAPALQEDDELPETLSQPLPVVDEDKELSLEVHHTRRHRSQFPRHMVDPYQGRLNMQGSASQSNPHHRLYHYSYNPVSRQDSELQSLSSDTRTDSMSDLTYDQNVSQGSISYTQKRQQQRQSRMMRENAYQNQNPDHFKQIPRTSDPRVKEMAKPREPAEFAAQLMAKLEKLKKDQETDELMALKLSTISSSEIEGIGGSSKQSMCTAAYLKTEDEDQEILDKHVSRVWQDKTPRRSPGTGTPVLSKSPPNGRKGWPPYTPSNKLPGYLTGPGNRALPFMGPSTAKRKDKDGYSSFSIDSGNATDPTECFDQPYHHRSSGKSKSISEHGDAVPGIDHHGHHHSLRSRPWAGSRRTVTSDSGVSMKSGGMDEVAPVLCNKDSNRFVTTWLSSNKPGSVESRDEREADGSAPMKPNPTSGSYSHGSNRNKMGMPDRSVGRSKNIQPAQPFVADPSMPPFSFHNINPDITVEELRRRLVQIEPGMNQSSTGSKMSSSSSESIRSGDSKAVMFPQRTSSLTRGGQKPCSDGSSVHTSVVCNFSDEPVPYLLKVPGNPITLKMFKDHMPPKKGNYRYFFVTSFEDLDTPIQEEITEDNQFLPLWKGKVNAQIKAVE